MSVVSDPIGDFLTRLRNAGTAGLAEVRAPHSRLKEDIAKILHREGYINGFKVEEVDGHRHLIVVSKLANRKSAITGLKRVSRPGLRKYVGATEIPRVLGGLGIAVLSTPRGVLSGREAKKQNVGGELLAYIW